MLRRLARTGAAGLLVVLGLGIGMLLTAPGATAVDCRPDQDRSGIARLTRQADAVFVGKVDGQEESGDRLTYTVDATLVYSGDITSTPVEVHTPTRPAACGLVDVPAGERWVFFVTQTPDGWRTDQLSGSQPVTPGVLDQVQETVGHVPDRVLPEPQPTQEPLTFSDPQAAEPIPLGKLVAPGAAAFLIGLLGWVAVRRRARR